MPVNLLKALPELIEAGVLSPEKAEEIRSFYRQKSSGSQNRLVIVFGILGAIMVGAGIILIIAHNWDDLSKGVKTFFAFLPLIIAQIICAYVLIKKQESITWKEGSASFLVFMIGASISLVSQIYHIPGNMSAFLFTWIILSLPLVYLMQSTMTALLVISGSTWYACETGYWSYPGEPTPFYWLFMLTLAPHYLRMFRKKPESNFTVVFQWLFLISLIICLGTVAKSSEELMFIAYFSMFGIFYLFGNSAIFQNSSIRSNAYLVLGSAGTIVLLLVLSFDGFWKELYREKIALFSAPEFYVSSAITVCATVLLIWQIKQAGWRKLQPLSLVFLLFIVLFVTGFYSTMFPVIMINILIFAFGILITKKGTDMNHLAVLNYGLLIITVLLTCRFFDTNISFIIRGLLFVVVGSGFFIANYRLIKKRRTNEN